MIPRFQIGDQVFKSRYDNVETRVICPDCGGTKYVRMLLHDDTEIRIECGGCDPGGYEPSTGTIKQYAYTTVATPYTVTGVNQKADSVGYELNNFGGGMYWTAEEKDLFRTGAEAMEDGEKKKAAHEAEENKRLMAKTKDSRSWAWNATYHRKCAKEAERQLEYHRSKAQICAKHVKEEKVPA